MGENANEEVKFQVLPITSTTETLLPDNAPPSSSKQHDNNCRDAFFGDGWCYPIFIFILGIGGTAILIGLEKGGIVGQGLRFGLGIGLMIIVFGLMLIREIYRWRRSGT